MYTGAVSAEFLYEIESRNYCPWVNDDDSWLCGWHHLEGF